MTRLSLEMEPGERSHGLYGHKASRRLVSRCVSMGTFPSLAEPWFSSSIRGEWRHQ